MKVRIKVLNVRKFLRSEGFKGQKVLKVIKVRIKVLKVKRFSRSESFEGRKVTVTSLLASLYREEHFVVVLHLHGLVCTDDIELIYIRPG